MRLGGMSCQQAWLVFTIITALSAVVSGKSNVTKANCDFDTDVCGYENPKFKYGKFFKTDFQWSRHKGDIKSGTSIVLSSSSPVGDHTSGKGYYLILDNSKIYSMRIGGGIELITPTLVSDRPFCLTFWYFIKDSNEFRVDLHTENTNSTIWRRPNLGLGEISKPWTRARVEIDSQSSTFKIYFVAKRASEGSVEVAIDDIVFLDSYCDGSVTKSSWTSTTSTIKSGKIEPSATTSPRTTMPETRTMLSTDKTTESKSVAASETTAQARNSRTLSPKTMSSSKITMPTSKATTIAGTTTVPMSTYTRITTSPSVMSTFKTSGTTTQKRSLMPSTQTSSSTHSATASKATYTQKTTIPTTYLTRRTTRTTSIKTSSIQTSTTRIEPPTSQNTASLTTSKSTYAAKTTLPTTWLTDKTGRSSSSKTVTTSNPTTPLVASTNKITTPSTPATTVADSTILSNTISSGKVTVPTTWSTYKTTKNTSTKMITTSIAKNAKSTSKPKITKSPKQPTNTNNGSTSARTTSIRKTQIGSDFSSTTKTRIATGPQSISPHRGLVTTTQSKPGSSKTSHSTTTPKAAATATLPTATPTIITPTNTTSTFITLTNTAPTTTTPTTTTPTTTTQTITTSKKTTPTITTREITKTSSATTTQITTQTTTTPTTTTLTTTTPTTTTPTTTTIKPPDFNITTLEDCLSTGAGDCDLTLTSGVEAITRPDSSVREWMFSSRYGDLQASLQTPLLPRDADPFCLEFSYLINQTGADLVVELVSSQDTNPRHIHLVYKQSDSWISERVTVTPINHHYKIQFTAFMTQVNVTEGVSVRGITFLNQTCESLQTTSPSSVSTLRPEDREFTCYFNAELCGFIHSNYSSPVYQWHTNANGGVSVMGDYGEAGGLASIISPVLPYKNEICITLNITTSPSMAVSINSVYNDSLHTEIARINTMNSKTQIQTTVNLTYPRSQIQFDVLTPQCKGMALITYLNIKPSRCDSDTNLTVYNEPSICSKSSPSSASSTSTQSTSTQSQSPSTSTTTKPTTVTTSAPAPVQLSCDFTDDYCGFLGDIKNTLLFSWTRSDGSKSGPQHRNSTTGYYIAADASKYKTAATLSTPELSAGAQCLEFYYHASGEGQKEITLNVLYMGSHNKLLWTHSGDAGDNWNKVQLEIPQENSNYRIDFEVKKKNSFSTVKDTVIALDEIIISKTQCLGAATIPTTQSTTTPTPKPVVPGDCSFDTLKNWCGYQSLNTTDFDWQQDRGRASSTFFTGPDSDHSGSGYYLYMDASTPATESTLYQIVSPELSQQCPMCFSFYYYMYGNETGSLNVFLYQNNTYNLVWKKQGDQGKKWLMGNVELNTDLPFRIIVEGIVGDGYRGDIAIDDFFLYDGLCQPKVPELTTAQCSTSKPVVSTTRKPVVTTKTYTMSTSSTKPSTSTVQPYNLTTVDIANVTVDDSNITSTKELSTTTYKMLSTQSSSVIDNTTPTRTSLSASKSTPPKSSSSSTSKSTQTTQPPSTQATSLPVTTTSDVRAGNMTGLNASEPTSTQEPSSADKKTNLVVIIVPIVATVVAILAVGGILIGRLVYKRRYMSHNLHDYIYDDTLISGGGATSNPVYLNLSYDEEYVANGTADLDKNYSQPNGVSKGYKEVDSDSTSS